MNVNQLKELCSRLAPNDGITATGLDGVLLYRVSNPMNRLPGVYTPRFCLNVSGSKRVFQSGQVREYGEGSFFCCTMPLPVESDIPKATKKCPLLGISLEFDEQLMTETVIEMSSLDDDFRLGSAENDSGLLVGKLTSPLSEAMYRILSLVEDRSAASILGRGRLKEAYFQLLKSDAGPFVRHRFGKRDKITDVISFLKDNLHESFSMDDLAERAGMSRAVFFRRFKAMTSVSPVQFLKSLRLNTAAMHLASGLGVNEAAFEVGYASPSQFSREFKRQFGMAPREWEQGFDIP